MSRSLQPKEGGLNDVISLLHKDAATTIRFAPQLRRSAGARPTQRVRLSNASTPRSRTTRIRVAAAKKAVQVAEAGVGKAQRDYASALADAAADDAAPPMSGMRAARQAVVEAQDSVAADEGALAQLKGTLPDFEAEFREAEIAVEAEISKILAVAVQNLIEKATEIARELSPLRKALLAFVMNDFPPRVSDRLAFDRGRQPLREAQNSVDAFFQAYDAIEDRQVDFWAVARRKICAQTRTRPCPTSPRHRRTPNERH